MTYISDLDPNPDFPFAAVGQSGVVYALFEDEEEADEFLETSSTGASRVVDTRPKPKPDPKDGEVWVITEGLGSYASKVPFLAFVRNGSFLFWSAYETSFQESGLAMLPVASFTNGSVWAGYRVHTPEEDD